MTHPTREQIEAARAYLEPLAKTRNFSTETTAHLRVLLAATAEPKDEELQVEAEQRFGDKGHYADERHGYIAGARREGAR